MDAFDPLGDVVLKLPQKHLRVSSTVLAFSSPVFRKMLESSFQEGRSRSPENPCAIELPGDDIDAVQLYCATIHFQPTGLSPTPETLVALAELCDKYKIQNSISDRVMVWARRLITHEASIEGLSAILVLAYVLNLIDVFAEASHKLLLVYPGSFEEVPCTSHFLLRDNFAGKQYFHFEGQKADGMPCRGVGDSADKNLATPGFSQRFQSFQLGQVLL